MSQMYQQAEPVRTPPEGSGEGQASGPPPQHPPARQRGGRDGASHIYLDCQEGMESSSDAYEEAEVSTPYATHTSAGYPGGARDRRCGFIRTHRSCLATTVVVALSLVALGLAPIMFINTKEISQLTIAVDTWKGSLDNVRNRTTHLEQRLDEMRKTLEMCVIPVSFGSSTKPEGKEPGLSGPPGHPGQRAPRPRVDKGPWPIGRPVPSEPPGQPGQPGPRPFPPPPPPPSARVSCAKAGRHYFPCLPEDKGPLAIGTPATPGPPPGDMIPWPIGPPGPLGPLGDKELEPELIGPQGMTGPSGSPRPGLTASCPEGYKMRRGICYKAFIIPEPFMEAAAACGEDGGTLAMPRDADTDAFLISLYTSLNLYSPFWFGLHDIHREGRFEWIDGTALGKYSSWGGGQPDNYEGREDCVGYSHDINIASKWNDEPCSVPRPFLCQVVPEREQATGRSLAISVEQSETANSEPEADSAVGR